MSAIDYKLILAKAARTVINPVRDDHPCVFWCGYHEQLVSAEHMNGCKFSRPYEGDSSFLANVDEELSGHLSKELFWPPGAKIYYGRIGDLK